MYESGLSKTAKFLFLILVLLLGYLFIHLSGCSKNPYDTPYVFELQSGKQETVYLEVADTPEKFEKGLMYREKMPENAGMLFQLEYPRVLVMWMKNTIMPLDMIFFGEDGKIVKIVENTTPYSLDHIHPGQPVMGVVELNAGSAQRLGIKVGDKIRAQ